MRKNSPTSVSTIIKSSQVQGDTIFDNDAIASAKSAIWDHLISHVEVAEYDLVSLVDNLNLFTRPKEFTLRIFHKHFIVQHCLYLLQRETFPQYSLDITPVKIRLSRNEAARQNQAVGTEAKNNLADYYLDLQNVVGVTADQVGELLADFWQKYEAHQNRDQHLKVLGLEPGASWEAVQARYRELAGREHPDKGGDAEAFIEIRRAFEALKKRF